MNKKIIKTSLIIISLLIISFLGGFLFFYTVLFLLISILLNVALHEAGHLIFGLLSKYKFVSYRFLSFDIIKNNSGFALKRYNIHGTLGQCIMLPPENNDYSKIPIQLYNAGGNIVNFLICIISLFFLWISNNIVFSIFAIDLLTIGIIILILNAIPNSNLLNDGYNGWKMYKDSNYREFIIKLLLIYGYGFNGIRIKDISTHLFPTFENVKNEPYCLACYYLIKASIALDKHDFNEYCSIVKEYQINNKIPYIYQYELKIDQAFANLISPDKDFSNSFYQNKDIRKYIKKSAKYQIDKLRFLYAKAVIYDKDINKADELYQKAIKMGKNYPLMSEYESEMEIINLIKLNSISF